MNQYPTKERLKQLLSYDSSTGVFKWKSRPMSEFSNNVTGRLWNGRHGGKVAGSKIKEPCGKSYVYIFIDQKRYAAHRLVFVYLFGEIDSKLQVDHINGDGADNRYENLRLVDGFKNHQNQRKPSNNTSGVTGVSWNKRQLKWVSSIRHNGINYSLGCYNKFEDAVMARKRAEFELGFHENHGKDRPL